MCKQFISHVPCLCRSAKSTSLPVSLPLLRLARLVHVLALHCIGAARRDMQLRLHRAVSLCRRQKTADQVPEATPDALSTENSVFGSQRPSSRSRRSTCYYLSSCAPWRRTRCVECMNNSGRRFHVIGLWTLAILVLPLTEMKGCLLLLCPDHCVPKFTQRRAGACGS